MLFVFYDVNAQVVYNFTTCGAAGVQGPNQTQVNAEYTAGNPLSGNVTVDATGIQYWEVPSDGYYSIDAFGAQGYGDFGGRGAEIYGVFYLNAGDTLKILVGQEAPPYLNYPATTYNHQFGGGGGTFVTYADNTPLVVAGGGGGNHGTSFVASCDGQITTAGAAGSSATTIGAGGTNGSGGQQATSADAGAGLLGDGAGTAAGTAFVNGGLGGGQRGFGGFGGGGGTSSWNNYRCGGGGGYSGGGTANNGGSCCPIGGGGGSYNNGVVQDNLAGVQLDDGKVDINFWGTYYMNVTETPITCNGANDASLSLSNTYGGVAPYTYQWSNGATTDSISNLAPGTYTVTITDANNVTGSISYTVTEPTLLTTTISVDANNDCYNGTDGVISTAPSGGVYPYTYSWSNGLTDSVATGLTQGTYTVTITDAGGCSISISDSVSSPFELFATYTTDPVSCHDVEDGAIYATNFGGTPPYSPFWSNGSFQDSIVDIDGGTYFYILTDANGCTFIDTVELYNPDELVLSVGQLVNATCEGYNNGSAVLDVQGGNGSNSFVWDNGLTSDSDFNLTDGSYMVTATDVNGCQDTTLVVVGYDNPTPDVNLGNDLAVGIPSLVTLYSNAIGSHEWSDGSTNTSLQVEVLSDTTIWVTVTSDQGCAGTDTVSIEGLVGIDGVENEYLVKMFPNPTSGELNIQIENNVANNIAIQVMDYSGKVVVNKEFNNTGSQFTDRINLNEFSKGIYFINIKLDDQIHTERIVVQ